MHRVPFVLLIPALLVLAACGSEQPVEKAPAADAHDHDAHAHEEGAHGGPVVVLGDHAGHLEGLHHADEQAVDVWITDGDFEPAKPDNPPVLNLVTEEGSVRLVADPHGDGWRFVHEALADHFEKARLHIELGGKTYTPDLPHGHEHEEHDEHD